MDDVYREKVGSLCRALESEDTRSGAVQAIRALIETILLEPDGDELIGLMGDLAQRPTESVFTGTPVHTCVADNLSANPLRPEGPSISMSHL